MEARESVLKMAPGAYCFRYMRGWAVLDRGRLLASAPTRGWAWEAALRVLALRRVAGQVRTKGGANHD